MIDITEVEKTAHIARLEMNDEQKADTAKSMNEVLGYIDALTKVNTDGIKPTLLMSPNNIMREDVVGCEFTQEEALANAPSAKKGCFAVPKVIG